MIEREDLMKSAKSSCHVLQRIQLRLIARNAHLTDGLSRRGACGKAFGYFKQPHLVRGHHPHERETQAHQSAGDHDYVGEGLVDLGQIPGKDIEQYGYEWKRHSEGLQAQWTHISVAEDQGSEVVISNATLSGMPVYTKTINYLPPLNTNV